MRFAHVTTFFGEEGLGGDAVYVERLARALAQRGHEIDVLCCPHSRGLMRRGGGVSPPPAKASPAGLPPGVRVRPISGPLAAWDPLWTHQTGRMGSRRRRLTEQLTTGGYDVIHLHNVSLLGGVELIELVARLPARGVMTAHDHWLTCGASTRFDRISRTSEVRCRGIRCAWRSRRPPQLWRRRHDPVEAAARLHAAIAPSAHTAGVLAAAGLDAAVLSPFAPQGPPPALAESPHAGRPYIAVAARLVPEKGIDRLVDRMAELADVDLVVAGDGPLAPSLRRRAARLPNVRLVGRLSAGQIAGLFAGALAVVVPSLWWEPFGLVALEAAAAGTPLIARDRGGLAEVTRSLGGILCDDDTSIVRAIAELAADPRRAARLGRESRRRLDAHHGIDRHLDRYGEILGIDLSRSGVHAREPTSRVA